MKKVLQEKNKVKCIVFIVVIYLLVFQNFLQSYISIFKYIDEFIAIMFFPFLVVRLKKNKIVKKDSLYIIILLIIIFILGMYSNFKYKYQTINLALQDSLLVFKFFFVYLLSKMVLSEEFISENRRIIYSNLKLIIYFLVIATILNYCFKIWPAEYRYKIMSNRLFYGHPTYLAAVCIFLMSLIYITSEKIERKIFLFLILILASTLRIKALGAAIVVLMIALYVNKLDKKISFSRLTILAIILIGIAHNQITFYFVETSDSARNMLLSKSIKIAKDYFPIGTGFGTYASYSSSIEYSPVYLLYRLNNVYGLQPGKTRFISDSFWPMIMGQFGILGTINYIIMLIIIFRRIQLSYNVKNNRMYTSKLIAFIYLLIVSTSESAFVNPIAIPLAIVIGIDCSNNKKKKENT